MARRSTEALARNAKRMKERYWDRRKRRVCVRCEAGLQETDVGIYCVECREQRDEEQTRYVEDNREHVRELSATNARKRYQADPEAAAKAKRDERNARQLDGKCYHCTADALPDSNFCAKHLERNRTSSRERARRRTGYYVRRFAQPSAAIAVMWESLLNTAASVLWTSTRRTHDTLDLLSMRHHDCDCMSCLPPTY